MFRKAHYQKFEDGGGGKTMYQKVIDAAIRQVKELGCFVAGTLVHTQDGPKPIEQIKVGDYVLSRPESGEDELSYQRVTRTFEYDDREIYFVAWRIYNYPMNPEVGYVVVTGEHPFWVKQRIASFSEYMAVNNWMTVRQMIQLSRDNEREFGLGTTISYTVQLADGREAFLSHFTEIMQGHDPDEGVAFEKAPYWPPSGPRVSFTEEGAVATTYNDYVRFVESWMSADDALDLQPEEEGTFLELTQGFPQMRRKVYNIEIENTHTYFVGAHGVWVHNTSSHSLR
jgi:hypothetical protein